MLYTALKPSALKRSNSETPVSRSVLDEPVGDSCCEARNGGVAFALGAAMKSEINTAAIKKLISTALIVKLLEYETPSGSWVSNHEGGCIYQLRVAVLGYPGLLATR